MKNRNDPAKPARGTESPASSDRRGTLKTLLTSAGIVAAGQALPERWIKPVVSSITLPAHAQMTVAPPAFECSITNSDVEMVQPELFIYTLQISTEAPDSTPVRFILRDPGSAEFNSESDVVDDTTVVGGEAGVESDFSSEFEGIVELDVDIGIDGEVDCGQDIAM